MFQSLLAIALIAPGGNPVEQSHHQADGKVCVAESTIKVTKKVAYASTCVDSCYTTHSLWSLLLHKDCPECGKVRTKTVLLKKTITTECPGIKCVPASVPCTTCETGGHPRH